MKIGDLVELSSKGRGILWCRRYRDRTGIVVDVAAQNQRLHTVKVVFMNAGSVWIHRSYVKMVAKG